MRHYEVMVILDAEPGGGRHPGHRRSGHAGPSRATVATVGKVDRWGKRRFAYEVHHRSEGYYVLIRPGRAGSA